MADEIVIPGIWPPGLNIPGLTPSPDGPSPKAPPGSAPLLPYSAGAIDLLSADQWGQACGPCVQSKAGIARDQANAKKFFAFGAAAGVVAGVVIGKLIKKR